jgi:hypothetical protein
MRSRMADHVETLGRIGEYRFHCGVVIELGREIDDLAVDTGGDQVTAWNPAEHVANDGAMRDDTRLTV